MFFCINPQCPRRQGRLFRSQRGLQQHLSKNQACLEYTQDQLRQHKRPKPNKTETEVCQAFASVRTNLERDRLNPMYMHSDPQSTNEMTNETYILAGNQEYSDNEDLDIDDNPPDDTIGIVPDDDDVIITFTKEQRHMCELMLLLDSFQAPDYAVEEVITWAQAAYQDGWKFNPKSKARRNNIWWMYSMIYQSEQFLPVVRPVNGVHGQTFDCIAFDFEKTRIESEWRCFFRFYARIGSA